MKSTIFCTFWLLMKRKTAIQINLDLQHATLVKGFMRMLVEALGEVRSILHLKISVVNCTDVDLHY